jgi:hypothetical protein
MYLIDIVCLKKNLKEKWLEKQKKDFIWI